MRLFTNHFLENVSLKVHSKTVLRTLLIALLLGGITHESFATAWTTGTAGPVTTLANWTNGTTSPTSFTTPGDTWTITLPMTMVSSATTWTVGTASSTAVTVTIAAGGELQSSITGGSTVINIYGSVVINGGTAYVGGAGASMTANISGNLDITTGSLYTGGSGSKITLNLASNYIMSSGSVATHGSSNTIIMNVNGNYSMNGGSDTVGGASSKITINSNGNYLMSDGSMNATGSGCFDSVIIKGNCNINGPSFMSASGAGATSTIVMSPPSLSGLSFIGNTSTGTWKKTNMYIAAGAVTQLANDFSSTLNSGPSTSGTFGITVDGTLTCPSTYFINGTGFFTVNAGATLAVAHATGINGAITTTGTKTFSPSANYTYNGTVAQVTGSFLPASLTTPSILKISNAAGVTLSQTTATTGTLAFTSGILNTGANTMSTPGAATAVTGAGLTSYVNGTLIKTITGLTSVNYEVGDLSFAPMSLALSAAGTGGSIGVKTTNGLHPNVATSGLSSSNMANHYWTVTNSGAAGPVTVTPTAAYNAADIIGGSNASFQTQKYAAAAWLSSALATTNASTPFYTSTPVAGIALATLAGDYIFGNLPCGTAPITGTPTVCVGAITTLNDATTGGTWVSSNTTVATISGGLVTGVSPGTTTISYTAGSCTVTMVVTVNTTPSVSAISGLSVVCIGLTTSLSCTPAGGTWSSSATGVATVSASGIVSGASAGNAVISYTASNSCGIAVATINVTVISSLSLGPTTGTDSVCPGSTVTLTNAISGGTWTSTNTAIATVSGGIVTGVAPGYDTIIYTVTTSCGTDTTQTRVKVRTVAECSVGIENAVANNNTQLTVFPNPNAGVFTLNLQSDINEEVQVTITNIMGKQIKQFTAHTNKPTDIHLDAAPGIYLIFTSGDHGRNVTKMVIE